MNLDRLMSIAHGWLPIFDSISAYEGFLNESGHVAFELEREFLRQFAEHEQDLAIHKRCYLEQSKMAVTNSRLLLFHPRECRERQYKSSYVADLRKFLARKAGFNDVRSWQESTLPSWSKEPDPLLRANLACKALRGREGYEHLVDIFYEGARAALENESKSFDEYPEGSFALGRMNVFAEALVHYLSPYGFIPVTSASADYFAMDLRIGDDFVLRWSINEDDSLFLLNPVQFESRS